MILNNLPSSLNDLTLFYSMNKSEGKRTKLNIWKVLETKKPDHFWPDFKW